jgi:YHS domain-containing protein
MIIRTIIIILIAYLAYRAVRWLLSAPKREPLTKVPASSRENLVQDPHCGTYIPESAAVAARVKDRELFFCSSRCRDEYLKDH